MILMEFGVKTLGVVLSYHTLLPIMIDQKKEPKKLWFFMFL